MSTEREYQQAKWELANFPDEIKGQERNRRRQELKHKIKEYEYSTTLPLFESMPHIPYFVNRTTTEPTLRQLIQTTTTATEFIIDTESINIYKQQNQPVLIQLQILLPYQSSLVLLIEMHHLPKKYHQHFQLIKTLFQTLFSENKEIFIWGSKRELYPFITFELFSRKQIDDTHIRNLQSMFKNHWKQQHPHTKSSREILNVKCRCEQCLGKDPSHIWSLQDGVAAELGEYLPKQLTNENFHIGLDNNLFSMGSSELEYRRKLIDYAINDCIAMERILIQMRKNNYQEKTTRRIIFNSLNLPPTSLDDEEQSPNDSPIPPPIGKFSSHLSEEERKQIHNRSCTYKQRQRCLEHTIVCNNVDNRFTIKRIKKILKNLKVPVKLVERSTATSRLYICISDPANILMYEEKIKNLFTTKEFIKSQHHHQRYRYHNRHNHHHYQRH